MNEHLDPCAAHNSLLDAAEADWAKLKATIGTRSVAGLSSRDGAGHEVPADAARIQLEREAGLADINRARQALADCLHENGIAPMRRVHPEQL